MIKYPFLKNDAILGVTAPSSGVDEVLHPILKQACCRMEAEGFSVVVGETAWTQDKAKSAPAMVRAEEFMNMMTNENIDFIVPPWGGELLIEILEYIDFDRIQEKWVMGYSDLSVLLLAITLKTGIATAHGTNIIDLRGEYSDVTTDKWRNVLSTKVGNSVLQQSSDKYQKKWQHDQPSPYVFHLTEKTEWKVVSDTSAKFQGRLLGGCIDVIRHLIGTPFGDVQSFRKTHIGDEPVIWYLENCELSTADLRRSLVQMKLAGWFEQCSGILFGRSPANHPTDNYTAEDVYKDVAEELGLPVVYDIDCGHVPPQITLINGAYAEVEVENGKGQVLQIFK